MDLDGGSTLCLVIHLTEGRLVRGEYDGCFPVPVDAAFWLMVKKKKKSGAPGRLRWLRVCVRLRS